MHSFEELLESLVKGKGWDLHISAGSPPRIPVDGKLRPIDNEALNPDQTQQLIYSILTSSQVARFEKELELDFSFGISGIGRFRGNIFLQRGSVGAVFRVIPFEVMSAKRLGLPQKLTERICSLPKGLVLVTGSTGSGKSTTLAAMLDYINNTRDDHVLTVEDPIEFVHKNKKCLFNQREVGSDTSSFERALRSALREDPDVVLIGEMRDKETIEAALTIAETGHLTFGTLHTSDCSQTINRIVDVFPSHQQNQIRTQLSFTLQAVFCQQLLPHVSGQGRVLVAEIMVANTAIRALIRDGKIHQMMSIIQTGAKLGMKTMNQALVEVYEQGVVSYDEIMARSTDPQDLVRQLQQKAG